MENLGYRSRDSSNDNRIPRTQKRTSLQDGGTQSCFSYTKELGNLSDHLFTLGTELIDEISAGTVGEATAIEFMGYLQNGLDEKRAQKILDDPENAEIPDDLGNLYALASHICSRASEKKVRSGAGRLLFRLPKEISVLIVRDLLRITPSFAAEDSCDEFLRENERLLA